MDRQSLSDEVVRYLCCPRCKQPLVIILDELLCTSAECGQKYPIIENIPILINEENSLFSIDDFHGGGIEKGRAHSQDAKIWLQSLLPSISMNLVSAENFRNFARMLLERCEQPLVLVVGGRVTGKGMDELAKFPSLIIVDSDVAFGPRTQLICDAHDLPFPDNFFDGVVAQAVLEHVVDPPRCVSEIHRVLKGEGLVYAETPFMQQVHEGRFDFTRYTHLGHRRLFRWFAELQSGPAGGPGMAMAWSIRYFLMSFSSGTMSRMVLGGISRLLTFFWKYFDPWLAKRTGGYDAAAGFYFLGQRSDQPLPDRELITQYRGAIK